MSDRGEIRRSEFPLGMFVDELIHTRDELVASCVAVCHDATFDELLSLKKELNMRLNECVWRVHGNRRKDYKATWQDLRLVLLGQLKELVSYLEEDK